MSADAIDVVGELSEADFLVYEQQPMLDEAEETEEPEASPEPGLEDAESIDAPEIIYGSPEAVRYFQKAALPHGGTEATTIDVQDLSVRSKLVVRPLSSPDTYVDRHGSPGMKIRQTNFFVALTPEPEPDAELETGQSESESELRLVLATDRSPVLETESLVLEPQSLPETCPVEESEHEFVVEKDLEFNSERVLEPEFIPQHVLETELEPVEEPEEDPIPEPTELEPIIESKPQLTPEQVSEPEPESNAEQALEPETESVIESLPLDVEPVPLEMPVESNCESVLESTPVPCPEPMNATPVLESEPDPIPEEVEPDSEPEPALETAPVLEEVVEAVVVVVVQEEAESKSMSETIPVPEAESPEPVLELVAEESDLNPVLENVAQPGETLPENVLESQIEPEAELEEIVPKEEPQPEPFVQMDTELVIETDHDVLDTETVLEVAKPESEITPPAGSDDEEEEEEEEVDELYTDEEDLVNKRHAARVASCLNDIHRPTSDEGPLDERADRMAEAILASAMFETVFLQPDDRSESRTPVPESCGPDLHFIGSSFCRVRFPFSGTCVERETYGFPLVLFFTTLFSCTVRLRGLFCMITLPIQHPQQNKTKQNMSIENSNRCRPLPSAYGLLCLCLGNPGCKYFFFFT